MAPVYFFLAIEQKFPFNFNYYMCLSIVKPPRWIHSPKMTTTSYFFIPAHTPSESNLILHPVLEHKDRIPLPLTL